MNEEEWRAAAKDLARRGWYGDGVPLMNLFTRVIALVGDAEVRWCGGQLTFTGRDVVSGPVYFYTDDLLIFGNLTDFGTTTGGGSNHLSGECQIQVVSRASLSWVKMPEDGQGNPTSNRSEAWAFTRSGWPPEGCVVLQYEALEDPLTLRPGTIGDFDKAVPSIVADLARS